MNLRKYQKDCINNILNLKYGEKGILVLPTGSGKTIILANVVNLSNKRTLIIVPSTELREQTVEKILSVNPSLDVGSVQASLDDVDSRVIISTRQSLSHKKSTRIERMLKNGDFEFVIIDETHLGIYQVKKIIEKLNKNTKIIGLTATPYVQEIYNIFDKIIYEKQLIDMIQEGYLCEPKAMQIITKTNLIGIKSIAGDFNQKQLEDRVNNLERNQLVVQAYKQFAHNRKSTLVFTTGIEHCNDIVKEFNKQGIKCKSVDSTLDTDNRQNVLNEFKNGLLPVICNVNILTTGFNHEQVDCIILASPTKSKIKYVQSIGRGLRLHPNKQDCLIIDMMDSTRNHDLMNISSVFGFDFNNGETVKVAYERTKKEKVELEKKKVEQEIRRQEELKLVAQQVILFNKDMKKAFKETYYDWFMSQTSLYILSKDTDNHFAIEMIGDNEFLLFKVCTKKDNKNIELLEESNNLQELIELTEKNYLRFPTSFAKRNTAWKKEPATDAQKKCCRFAKYKWQAHSFFTSMDIQRLVKKWHKIN